MTPAKGYMEMKDSGIEWVGMIPAHWGICKIKYTVTQETLRAENNGGYIGLENVESWSGKIIDKHNENVVVEGASLAVCPNDILFGKLRPYLAKCAIAEKSGCCSTEFIVMRPHSIEGRFLKYVMLTPQFIDMVNMSTYGAKMPRANWDFIGNALLAMPSRDEQAAIASYLDAQCAKIDEIIAQAKASIEDYKQWKASIIYEAVTKGLDPNVEMKDSGIPWIGKIPVHWAISRIKNIATNLDYLREPISAENRENKLGLYDYYGASGVIDKIDDYNVDDTVLLIGEDGANLRMRNLPLVYRASGKFWVNNHAHILKVKPGCSYGYVAYLLEAGDYNVYITGSAQPKLSQFNLMRFPIVIPDFKEQVQIEKYLDKWCLQIDTLIAEKEDFLIDLESYKKSLIYEVVTGKRRM